MLEEFFEPNPDFVEVSERDDDTIVLEEAKL
jgi:hypothetical protein